MDAKKLGLFIAQLRKEQNMTQADLARKLQVTDKAISKWERGKSLPDKLVLLEQITVNQILQKLIAVQLTNHASGIIVVCDICGIFGQKIAYDLVDGIITLFIQSIEHITKNSSHILLIIAGYCKFNGAAFRHGNDLLPIDENIISQFF